LFVFVVLFVFVLFLFLYSQGGAMLLAYRGEFVPVDSVVGDFLPPSVIRAFVRDRFVKENILYFTVFEQLVLF
jgi:hypothetical protein